MPQFERYIGVDYSGAQTPESSLKGLRVYAAESVGEPHEVLPQLQRAPVQRKYWTRRGIAEWIKDTVCAGPATLVGIDHGFSFPLEYFEITICAMTGTPSLMISSITGRQIKKTSMSISCAKDIAATVRCEPARLHGAESLSDAAGQNQSSTSTCRAQLRNRLIADFPGFGSFDCTLQGESTSGLLMAGKFHLGSLRL